MAENRGWIIDTHAHYENERFDEDREELIGSLRGSGIGTVIDVGASYGDLEKVVSLAERYPFIYAAIGIHPYDIGDLDEGTWAHVRELSLHPRCVAVGEIGLDYHEWPDEPPLTEETKDAQKFWFRRQMKLSDERRLPFIIHSRDAAKDTMDILKEEIKPGMTGVMHCYSYSPEVARTAIDMGLYIGVGGVVTFKSARKLKETVKMMPLDRLLLETDCPYMAPEPHRGKRNSSLYLPHVVKAIAQLREITEEEVVEVTEENAKRLFGGILS